MALHLDADDIVNNDISTGSSAFPVDHIVAATSNLTQKVVHSTGGLLVQLFVKIIS